MPLCVVSVASNRSNAGSLAAIGSCNSANMRGAGFTLIRPPARRTNKMVNAPNAERTATALTALLEKIAQMKQLKLECDVLKAQLLNTIEREKRYKKDGYLVYYRYPGHRKTVDYDQLLKKEYGVSSTQLADLKERYWRYIVTKEDIVVVKQRAKKNAEEKVVEL